MSLKTVHLPHLNRTVKMGRLRPVPPAKAPRLFESFLGAIALPAPPVAVDYSPKGQPALALIFGNETLGDCVIAMIMHLLAVLTGNAGKLYTATMAQVIAYYSAIGGYVPGDPSTDQGCDEVTAMNYLKTTGFPDGTKLAGWVAIDATNQTLMKQAIDLFEGGIFFAVELPAAWLNNAPSANGFTWDLAGPPDPSNGHAFLAVGYNAQGVLIDTWGLIGTMTWAAVASYAVQSAGGAAYVVLATDQLGLGQTKAPNNIDWPTLIAYFDAIGGQVPIPPTPAPTPVPPNPVVYQFNTTTTVSVPSNLLSGQAAKITAAVTPMTGAPGTPTGGVKFTLDGVSTVHAAPLSGPLAVFTSNPLAAGPHTVTAHYTGDTFFSASDSAEVVFNVTGPTPSTPLTLAQVIAAGADGINAAHLPILSAKTAAIDAMTSGITAAWTKAATGTKASEPQEEITMTPSSVLDLFTRAFAFVNGYVDQAELAKVVIASQSAGFSLQAAAAAVKSNEAIIFKDQLARLSADAILSLLVDTAKQAALAAQPAPG